MDLQTRLKSVMFKLLPSAILQYLRKVHYLNKLKSFSEKDEVDLSAIKYLIRQGDSAIDVGANYGSFTLFLSRLVGDGGHVYSIEPIPVIFEVLANNVKKLKLHNVNLFDCAISDQGGSAIMEIPKWNSGGENFYRAKVIESTNQDASLRHFPVRIKTLDSLLHDISSNIAFIKIDVEGHELQAINGAMHLLHHFKPALLIEVSGNPDDYVSLAGLYHNIAN
jgi:FkbM family methyltransferase